MPNYRIVIFANTKYLTQCLDRITEFDRLGIDNFFFYCLDTNLYSILPTKNKELIELNQTIFQINLKNVLQ
jgi:hypothetical protein